MIIGMPVYDGADLLDMAGAYEMFHWAGFETDLLAETPGLKTTGSAFAFQATRRLGDARAYDAIWVPGGEPPSVVVPRFMKEIIEELSIAARKSKYIDHASGVSARFSIANYRTMIASARKRAVQLGERPAVPRISDLGPLYASSLGKQELDLMGSHQMTERQVLDTLVDAGVARSRAEALAWCVKLVGQHEGEWINSLREALNSVQEVRQAGPSFAPLNAACKVPQS